jgi:hypothetical protein
MGSRRGVWINALSLFAVLIAVYTFSYNGAARVDDEHILAARAQSLALQGRLEAPQVYGNARVRDLQAMGDRATQVEPVQSILGAWLYKLGITFGWGGRQTAFTLNLYATALTAVLLFLAVLSIGFRLKTAWIVSLAFGLATPAFPYALTFYRDPLAMALSTGSLLGAVLLAHRLGHRRIIAWTLIVIGLVLGILTKNSVFALFMALVLGLGPLLIRGHSKRIRLRNWILAAIVICLPIVASALIPARGPLARFSWAYYRDLARYFGGSIDISLAAAAIGPWVSPAKSMILFAPPLVMIAFGLRSERIPGPIWRIALSFAVLLGLAQGLFYRDAWAGGFGWALRFMLPALPALMLLTAPGFERVLGGGPVPLLGTGGLLAAGFLSQLAAAWTPWQPIYRGWVEAGLDPYGAAAAWDPRLLAIPKQVAELLNPEHWDIGWLRMIAVDHRGAIWIPILSLSIIGLVFVVRRLPGSERARRLRNRLIGAMFLAALVLPIFPAMTLLRGDPAVADDRASFHQAKRWIEGEISTNDVAVIDSYGTPLWSFFSNQWTEENRWYSLAFEPPAIEASPPSSTEPSASTVDLLDRLLDGGHRIWYLTTPESPDASLGREVHWLRVHATALQERVFEEPVTVTVLLVSP